MRWSSAAHASLTGRLLRGMVLPTSILAVLLGVGGAVVIRQSVQTVNDRILGAASRAIADSLAIDQGEVALNLSPAIFGMLEDNERDNVYYAVRQDGRTITGYQDLPDMAPSGLRDLQVIFANARFRGHDIRVVSEGRRLPGLDRPLVVEVAETMDARRRTSRRMLEGLALLELILIGVAAILLPIAVHWGMRPLRRLRDEMDRRVASDLTPLPDQHVPRELRDLVMAFNRLLARVDSTLQRMRRFTADASHQMRTPLSILRTHISLLRAADPGSAEAENSLSDIDQASARLQDLLVQLLALARADNVVSATVAKEMVDLNELAEEIAAEHAPDAVRHEIDVQFDRSPFDVRVKTHKMLAAELIGNLVDNAIRYNEEGGTVCVSVIDEEAGPSIVVEDDGPGIPPGQREAVFTRFTRLHGDPQRTGSGLGLPIARMLAESLDSELRLETARNGKGLRAIVSFK